MKQNVKIAKELVKLAKNLVGDIWEGEPKYIDTDARKEFKNVTGKIQLKKGWIIQVKNATFDYYYNNKYFPIIWKSGDWENGTWKGGYWWGGTWEDGIWEFGEWKGGYWQGGTWENGDWENEKDSVWLNGVWKEGRQSIDNGYKQKIHRNGDSPDKWNK